MTAGLLKRAAGMSIGVDSDAGPRIALPWPDVVCMLLAPLGIVVASFAIPFGVDELPTSDSDVGHTLDLVARHPFGTRLGFLAFAAAMLLLLGAMGILRRMAERERRGRALTISGTWLIAVAAGAIAIGNAFAPPRSRRRCRLASPATS